LGGLPPLRTPKFGQNNCVTYNFLHSEFQLSMLSSLSFIFGGCLPRKTPKFGQNNCLTYNFLHCEFQLYMSSHSKWPFFWLTFWGNSLTWSLIKTICKQPPPSIGLYFHQFSDFYIKQSRRS